MPVFDEEEYLAHYGTPRKSGRYPWGSGGPDLGSNHRNLDLLGTIEIAKQGGLSDKEIYEGLGMKSSEFRAQKTIEIAARKADRVRRADYLVNTKQMSKSAAAREMGIPESTLRTLLAPGAAERAGILMTTANELQGEVESKKWIDVGTGVENHLGISKEKLTAAVNILRRKGYELHTYKVPQVGNNEQTTFKVLGLPGTTQKEAWMANADLQQIDRFSIDGGRSYTKPHPWVSINPNRLGVRYAEDGGTNADGVVYVRPGKKDLSLGKSHYAQVRIQIGEDHYIKGMAVYKDDLPKGVDLLFNTNKTRVDAPNKLDALKPIKRNPDGTVDRDLPFGSVVRQIVLDHKGPNERVESAMNIVNEEGSWKDWSKTLSTQLLSKQSPVLIRQQLDATQKKRQKDFDEIMELTNPSVRKKLLEDFARETDSAAVHLEAVGLTKNSQWHVILPVESMKPTEVFAPNYPDGERVALIRYPHGGRFEIPDLIVNNSHPAAIKAIGKGAPDAIGIHPKVAERLSGADFDGDTVIVIPNNSGKIKSASALPGLVGFEPRIEYKAYPGMVRMRDLKDPGGTEQQQMGSVSNLITDMTIRGAPPEHIARAVRHSMVVIDARKHDLDYKKSAINNGIAELKREYQHDPEKPKSTGASTLISRAGAEVRVPKRKVRLHADGGPINEKGELQLVPTGQTRKGKNGERVPVMEKVKKLALTNDAHSLSSGTTQERLYADHSNQLKDMANKARIEYYNSDTIKWNPSAKRAFSTEVDSLKVKLHEAQLNSPRERQAQIIANAMIKAKRQANPNLGKEEIKKIERKSLAEARDRTGAGKQLIEITEKEWHAIQSGAISPSQLDDILRHADMDIVKKLATPKAVKLMSTTKQSKAKAMLAAGATRAEVAAALGVSTSTLDRSFEADGGTEGGG
jgi:hypothetical protein